MFHYCIPVASFYTILFNLMFLMTSKTLNLKCIQSKSPCRVLSSKCKGRENFNLMILPTCDNMGIMHVGMWNLSRSCSLQLSAFTSTVTEKMALAPKITNKVRKWSNQHKTWFLFGTERKRTSFALVIMINHNICI